jgi:hypothetical protein
MATKKTKTSELNEAASIEGLLVFATDNQNNSVKAPIALLKGNKGDKGNTGSPGAPGAAGKAPRVNGSTGMWEVWNNDTAAWVSTGVDASSGYVLTKEAIVAALEGTYEPPVNEIRYSTELAGNIFGNKYLKCNGAIISKDDYPLLLLPEGLIAFRAENSTIVTSFHNLAILYANGKYVIGGYYSYLFTGSSLTTLTSRSPTGYTSGLGRTVRLRYLNGRFYALSGSYRTFAWSNNGDGWTVTLLEAFVGLGSGFILNVPVMDAAYGNDLYVFVGDNANIAVSSDGIYFGKQSTDLNVNSPFFSIAFGNGIFVVLGGSYGTTVKSEMYTSTGSGSWTNRGETPLFDCFGVTFIDSHFVLLSNAGVAYSDDGIAWTTGDEQARGFHAYGGGVYIRLEKYSSSVYGPNTRIKASTDVNLVEWVNIMDFPTLVNDVIYDGSRFIFVGSNISPHVSTDAIQLPLIENAYIKALE